MLQTNTLLPQTIARVCTATNTTLGHVSSAASIRAPRLLRMEGQAGGRPGLTTAGHFSRRSRRSSVALQKRTIQISHLSARRALFIAVPRHSRRRHCEPLRPISGDCVAVQPTRYPDNFLSHLQDGFKFHDSINSISHVDECVGACLELWEQRAPVGVYNVVNPAPCALTRLCK